VIGSRKQSTEKNDMKLISLLLLSMWGSLVATETNSVYIGAGKSVASPGGGVLPKKINAPIVDPNLPLIRPPRDVRMRVWSKKWEDLQKKFPPGSARESKEFKVFFRGLSEERLAIEKDFAEEQLNSKLSAPVR
jgi:hypothetical protein